MTNPTPGRRSVSFDNDLVAGLNQLAERRTNQLTAIGIHKKIAVSDVIREGVEKLLAAEGLTADKRAEWDRNYEATR